MRKPLRAARHIRCSKPLSQFTGPPGHRSSETSCAGKSHLQQHESNATFPKKFQGLSKLNGEYVIKLKDDHTPFAISVLRRVAISLMGKVRAELERMEGRNPTDWYAALSPNQTAQCTSA